MTTTQIAARLVAPRITINPIGGGSDIISSANLDNPAGVLWSGTETGINGQHLFLQVNGLRLPARLRRRSKVSQRQASGASAETCRVQAGPMASIRPPWPTTTASQPKVCRQLKQASLYSRRAQHRL